MSMARSTPAQNPRGPANTISAIRLTISLLLEVKGYARHPAVGLETAVGVLGVTVGDVDHPVPGVEGDAVRHEEGCAQAAGQPEGEVRVDLDGAKIGAAGRRQQLDVRHEPAEREEVIAAGEREACVVLVGRLRVSLIDGLESGLECAVEEAGAERVPWQIADARACVPELESGLYRVVLEIVLLAGAAFEGP